MAQYVFSMNRVGKIVPPKRHILKDISLSFFPGAKIGVLGTNGSGKSTLLKIMAGLDKDIEGEAIPMAGLNIGYLPQEPQLDPTQTVRESVEAGMGKVFAAKARLEERQRQSDTQRGRSPDDERQSKDKDGKPVGVEISGS